MNPKETYNKVKQTGKNWWIFLILGILALGVGVWMFCFPAGAATIAVYVFAAYFLISGIVDFVNVIIYRNDIPAWGWPLVASILVIAFGVMLLCSPLLSAGVLDILFACGIICMGIRFIASTVLIEGVFSQILIVLFGVLIIVSGVMCIYNPAAGLLTVATLEALSMIFAGIACLSLSYQLSRLNSVRKKFEESMQE